MKSLEGLCLLCTALPSWSESIAACIHMYFVSQEERRIAGHVCIISAYSR